MSKSVKAASLRDYINGFLYFSENIRDFLHPSSISRLTTINNEAFDLLDTGKYPIHWDINIPRKDPLRFITFSRKGCKLEVDLNCRMQLDASSLKEESLEFSKYNAEIRIWSHDPYLSYRPQLDSKLIRRALKKTDWKRVMLSFHMDLKNTMTSVDEPKYHLHVGGRLSDEELSWIPKLIDGPRFYFYPMDIILLTEFILLNFLPEESKHLRSTSEWIKRVQQSQSLYLNPYITEFNRCLFSGQGTLLTQLTSPIKKRIS